MIVGIYTLYWEEQDLVYVGQSQNIEKRFRDHSNLLNNNSHSNYKVQHAYNLYGNPKLTIIEECLIEHLNNREIYWTKEFDSLNTPHGLNIIEAGQAGRGTNHSSSKYSRRQVLKVFSFLYRTDLSYIKISAKTGVHKQQVATISAGKSHLWLKEEYPIQYIKMLQSKECKILNRNINNGNRKNPISLISPTKVLYENIHNIIEFCRSIPELSSNPVNSSKGLSSIIMGSRKQYKGWRLAHYGL